MLAMEPRIEQSPRAMEPITGIGKRLVDADTSPIRNTQHCATRSHDSNRTVIHKIMCGELSSLPLRLTTLARLFIVCPEVRIHWRRSGHARCSTCVTVVTFFISGSGFPLCAYLSVRTSLPKIPFAINNQHHAVGPSRGSFFFQRLRLSIVFKKKCSFKFDFTYL